VHLVGSSTHYYIHISRGFIILNTGKIFPCIFLLYALIQGGLNAQFKHVYLLSNSYYFADFCLCID
jgi:hypothetical protein